MDPYWKDSNAESFSEFIKRIKRSIEKLNTLSESKISVFTHGQYLLTLRLILLNPNDSDKDIMSKFKIEHDKFPINNTQMFTFDDLKK